LFPGLTGFENIRGTHHHGHFVRAILESTATSLNLLLSGIPDAVGKGIVSTGGGAQSRLWIEIKANTTGRVFYLPEYNETACLGAAMLGAAVTRNSGNLKEISATWASFKEIIRPVSGNQGSG
jgi:xylulokinase